MISLLRGLLVVTVMVMFVSCGKHTHYNTKNGVDGQDGKDGKDAVVLKSVEVRAGECVEVSPGIWAENIRNGQLADIYMNASCADNQGEFCDNLIPSYGRSGQLSDKDHEGSGTTCWASNVLITAHKELESSTTIQVKVILFN